MPHLSRMRRNYSFEFMLTGEGNDRLIQTFSFSEVIAKGVKILACPLHTICTGLVLNDLSLETLLDGDR